MKELIPILGTIAVLGLTFILGVASSGDSVK
jgi:hypothetical protein